MSCSPLLHSLPCQRAFSAPQACQNIRNPRQVLGSQRLQRRSRSPPCSRPLQQPCRAQKKGFGSGKTRSRRRTGPALDEDNKEWVPVANMSEFKKPTLPKILRDNTAIVLYNVGGEVYCSDANSTAFKFPLIDANILEREDGPAVQVPLDGTVYELETGKVLTWCPKDNPIRFLLGSLKSQSTPEPLRVYPARVNDYGKIYVKFTKA